METLNVKYYSGQTIVINSCGSMEEDVFANFFKRIGEQGLQNIKDAFIITFPFDEPFFLVEDGYIYSAMRDMVEC